MLATAFVAAVLSSPVPTWALTVTDIVTNEKHEYGTSGLGKFNAPMLFGMPCHVTTELADVRGNVAGFASLVCKGNEHRFLLIVDDMGAGAHVVVDDTNVFLSVTVTR